MALARGVRGKLVLRGVFLLFVFISFGCNDCRSRQVKSPTKSNRLVVAMETEPPSLTPLFHPDQWGHRISSHQIYESLIRFDPHTPYPLIPELAKRYTQSEDGKTYRFELRKDVYWHDGERFSAKDVLFTFNALLNRGNRAASVRATLEPFIEKLSAPSDYRFEIRCKKKSPFFLKSLADVSILPAHIFNHGNVNLHPALKKPIGTGPYRLKEWKKGQSIVLTRFKKYWGSSPSIDDLEYRILRNPTLALELTKKGVVDFLPRVHGMMWENEVKTSKRLTDKYIPVEHITPGTSYVLFNHKNPLFANKRVRRALAQLLDVKLIVNDIMRGHAKRIASLYWIEDPAYLKDLLPIAYDPKAANIALDQAGWNTRDKDGWRIHQEKGIGPFSFKFYVTASSKSTQRWVTIYQQALKKSGIKMDIEIIEWASYLDRIRKHRYDMGTLGMALAGPYTDLYLQFHSSQIDGGQNYSGYSDKKVDHLLEAIRSELNDKKRNQLAAQLQRRLAEELPVIPLFTLTEPGLISKKIEGVYPSALWYQLRDWSIH